MMMMIIIIIIESIYSFALVIRHLRVSQWSEGLRCLGLDAPGRIIYGTQILGKGRDKARLKDLLC